MAQDDNVDNLERTVKALRKRVDELGREQRRADAGLRHALLACTVAGALLALTATTWRVEDYDEYAVEDVQTLWGMAPDGWPALVTLVLVVALGAGTVAVSAAGEVGRGTHLGFMVLALLTAAAVLMLVGAANPTPLLDADDYVSGPGRWLALLCALALAVVHGGRAAQLR